MECRQRRLRYFLAVAEALYFVRAAGCLHSLSRVIKDLE
ncbi:hypothetical protein AF72_05490 [Xylella taiwanensis]|uniref:Transposase n=1 Tax=Xylella taiwanensis TaxID=1444770 RepID=Z9JKJ6_9GAMM|nr:hypothetical protein AF72_05490 [Xylella taiwanensis]